MTPWNVLVLSLATSSTHTISPSPTVMSLNTWRDTRGGQGGHLLAPCCPDWPGAARAACSGRPTLWVPVSGPCPRPPALPPLLPDQHGGDSLPARQGQGLGGGGGPKSDSGTGGGPPPQPAIQRTPSPISLPRASSTVHGDGSTLQGSSYTRAADAQPSHPTRPRASWPVCGHRLRRPQVCLPREACTGHDTPPCSSHCSRGLVQAEL